MLTRKPVMVLSVLAFLLMCLPNLKAQGVTSSIVGTVVDSSGAAIPNAQVTLTNVGTKGVRTATTSTTGIFHFPTLLPGTYSVAVSASGFQAFTTTDIEVNASSTRDLGKIMLAVGSVSQTVTVSAAVTPIQTSSSQMSHTVTGSALNALPLRGRDMFGAVDLVPGVVDTRLSRDVTSPNGIRNVSINGNTTAKNFTVDGITDVDTGSNGTVHYEPNMEAIQEVKVLTSNYSAQYGRNSGGVIEVVTKSGTSQYHGSGYWNHRHEQFNANDYFNKKGGRPRSLYRYNVEGWSFGGPVPIPKYNSGKNKLFFFASQEYTGQLSANSTRYLNVPNVDLRGTSAADTVCNCINLGTTYDAHGSPISVIDPLTGNPFPNNQIPMSRVDSVGLAMLNYLPDQAFSPASCAIGAYQCNYSSSRSDTHPRRNDTIRIDWDPSPKLSSFFRWIRDYDDNSPSWYHFAPWPILPVDHPNPGHGYAGSFTYIFSPTLLNEVTVGYDWNTWSWYLLPGDLAMMNPSNIGNPPLLLPKPTSPQGVNGYDNIMPRFSFGGDLPNTPTYNGTSGLINYFNADPIWTVSDNLTKTYKSHDFKMGVYIEYNGKVQPSNNAYAGNYDFSVSSTNPLNSGNGYANALLGYYNSFTQSSARSVFDVKYWNVEPYFEDSWHATSRLTLDLGVRLYMHTPQADANGTFSYFDPAQYNSLDAPRIFVPACAGTERPCSSADLRSADPANLSALQPAAYIGAFVPGTGNPANGMVLAGPGQNTYKRTFPFSAAPRVGFAWDVKGDGRTAIRGGFGIFYNRLDGNQVYGMSGQVPYAYTYSASDGTISSLATTTGVITPASIRSYSGLAPWIRTYNGSLNIQRSLGFSTALSVAYVFNFGRHLNLRENINPVPLGANFLTSNISPITGKALTQVGSSLERTTYPGFQDINKTVFVGYSNYHALQVGLQHRLTRGLLFGLSYTWSKSLGATSFDPLVPDNNARNYGPNGNDRRQNFQINYSYALPGLSNSSSGFAKVAGAVINNWTFAGHTSFQSGAPLMIALSAPGQDITGSRSETARPDIISDPTKNVPSGFMFNPNAFALPAVGTIGNEGLNPVYSKGLNDWDMTLTKYIPVGLGESRGLRVQVQAYNVFNHPQFDPGTGGSSVRAQFNHSGTLVDAGALGKPASDGVGPRIVAFSLRFQF